MSETRRMWSIVHAWVLATVSSSTALPRLKEQSHAHSVGIFNGEDSRDKSQVPNPHSNQPQHNPSIQSEPENDLDQPKQEDRPRRLQNTAEEVDMELLNQVQSILTPLQSQIDTQLFLTQLFEPSQIYKSTDLLEAISIVYQEGVAGSHFYLGESNVALGYEYGLVNLAAFLAQCMKETIQYDACDENNWDLVNNAYPLSNACGQLEQSYQDYTCPPAEAHMTCDVDPNMEITATTHATWYGAPPPLFCGPKSKYPFTGNWDHNYWCDDKWSTPPKTCDVYVGQKSGGFDNSVAAANRAGRTDVEGCCWWGRGVIQSTGPCNYGKLNYFLGKRAADEGRPSRYPTIDFCKTPQIICAPSESGQGYPELKWIAGLFYWMKDVQAYNSNPMENNNEDAAFEGGGEAGDVNGGRKTQEGWYYLTELHKFVNGGMTDMRFIDSVSGIVNRGCHNPPCATGEVDGLLDRRSNFQRVLQVFGLPSASSSGGRPASTLPPIPSASAEVDNDVPLESLSVVEVQVSPLFEMFINTLLSHRPTLEPRVMTYQSTDRVSTLSDIYTFDTLIQSLTTAHKVGYGGKQFYVGPTSPGTTNAENPKEILKYGLVNLAAFLSQSFSESIQYNACDEFHQDMTDNKFPISNSCGQFGENYQGQTCPNSGDTGMQCQIRTDMEITAMGTGKYEDRPKFYCGPKSVTGAFTGAYDTSFSSFENSVPFPNSGGRVDVEGCCWWGRGALMTTGLCAYGKLNYYLGARAAAEGRSSLYPQIDFCSNPDICRAIKVNPTIAWDVGIFEWVDRIQSYDENGWNYMEQLYAFVDGGMNDEIFINSVSKIVTQGRPDAEGEVRHSFQRWGDFENLLRYLRLKADTNNIYPHYEGFTSSGQKRSTNGGRLPSYLVLGHILTCCLMGLGF